MAEAITAVLKQEEHVLVESIGKRTKITDPATKTVYEFEERPKYEYPVCDIPLKMARKIIAADKYQAKVAANRETEVNATRADNLEFAKQNPFLNRKERDRLKRATPALVTTPQLVNFRYAVEMSDTDWAAFVKKRNAAKARAAKAEKAEENGESDTAKTPET